MRLLNYTILSMCSSLLGAISSVVVSNTGVFSSYIIYYHPSIMREMILLIGYTKKEQSNDGWKLVYHMETTARYLDYC
jgi:hypothetical protein